MKTLIFDLDGTLLDSLLDIALSMNELLEELGFRKFDVQKYKNFVGGGIEILAKNVLKELNSEYDFKLLSKQFKQKYEQSLHVNTKPYENIYELLKLVNKHNLAVLSNKPHELTKAYVKKFFSEFNFTQVYGQRENFAKKPDPKVALSIAQKYKQSEVFFIGDTKVDMQTAKNANFIAIGVLWGFRNEIELRENGADFIVSNPLEIAKIVG